MTSVDPRALSPVPSASELAAGQPGNAPADERPRRLAKRRNGDKGEGEAQHRRIGQLRQVHLQPCDSEEDRAEEGEDEPAQFLLDMPLQDRRLADQDAGNECPKR